MSDMMDFKNPLKFLRKITFNYFYICSKSFLTPEFKAVLAEPDKFCSQDLLKKDHTTTVALVTVNKKKFVIKRYNIKGFRHGIKRAFSRSRAARCWYYAHLLHSLDINTPEPIAYMEKRFGPFRRQAYFISEFIPSTDGHEAFKDFNIDNPSFTIKAEKTVNLIKQLEENRISHGDFKDTNFIYVNNTPYIIDLDSMRQHGSFKKARKKISKDQRRFLENWEDIELRQYFENLLEIDRNSNLEDN